MTKDTIFRIASQTKALTSVAVMMLVEEGRVGLGDPVSRYIPAFEKTTVAVPPPAGRRRRHAGERRPREAARSRSATC